MTLDPKHAWQASGEIGDTPALVEIRARADKFYRRIRRRNTIEYVACILVVLIFGRQAFVLPHLLLKIGSGWTALAALYVAWQLHLRGSAISPDKSGGMPLFTFLRMQLVRQRDALRSIFWWYLLPFTPGLALILIGRGQDPEWISHVPVWAQLTGLSATVMIFAGVWWLNQWNARKLERRIEEIDVLMSEGRPPVEPTNRILH